MRLTPPPALGEGANAVNGFHRRFSRGPTNMWMSDADAGLPQTLLLEWPQPVTFSQVNLTFDTLHRKSEESPWHCGKRVTEFCVKDYDLEVWERDGWRTLLEVRGNHHRRREHEFPAAVASSLRLRVLATHDEGFGARVYALTVT